MQISEAFFGQVAVQIVEQLQKKDLLLSSGDPGEAAHLVKAVLLKNFQEQEEIEKEAERTMETLVKGQGEYDLHKMLTLLKNRIAAQRGFIL